MRGNNTPFAGEAGIVEFHGEFESHLTVHVEKPSGLEQVRGWAEIRGLKFHHIVLDRGTTPSQPMITRRGQGHLSTEQVRVIELCRSLTSEGFVVSRLKVEASPENQEIPISDSEAAERHIGRYFEHHIKLALMPVCDVEELTALAQRHGAHLSRNAFRVRLDGRLERFVTQRCHEVGRITARARLNELVEALRCREDLILSVEQEFVVLDTNPSIDAGWLDQEVNSCRVIGGNSSSK